MVVDRALHLLAAMATDAEGLFTGLAGTPRNHEKAKEVAGVFKEYATRLRELGLAPDGDNLTNAERDWIKLIAKRAREARTVLISADENPSLALDRAYSNVAVIEEDLDKLIGSRCKALLAQFAPDFTLGGAKGTPRQRDLEENSATRLPDKAYQLGSNVPPVPSNLHLDFESRNAEGKFGAPEGKFRASEICSFLTAFGQQRSASMDTCPNCIIFSRAAHTTALYSQLAIGVSVPLLGRLWISLLANLMVRYRRPYSCCMLDVAPLHPEKMNLSQLFKAF